LRRGPIDSGSCRYCKPNLDAGAPGHYIGRIMDETKGKPGPGKPDRAERLAEALRENLRKRKAQGRARRNGGAIGEAAGEDRLKNDSDTGEKR
jgi:hypothetical protein